MKSKPTTTAKTAPPAKASKASTVKTAKPIASANKIEKANGAANSVKNNGTVKKAGRQPSSPATILSPDATAKIHDIEQLKQRAYFNYLREGCPEDRAMQHWLDAEAQLAGE